MVSKTRILMQIRRQVLMHSTCQRIVNIDSKSCEEVKKWKFLKKRRFFRNLTVGSFLYILCRMFEGLDSYAVKIVLRS